MKSALLLRSWHKYELIAGLCTEPWPEFGCLLITAFQVFYEVYTRV